MNNVKFDCEISEFFAREDINEMQERLSFIREQTQGQLEFFYTQMTEVEHDLIKLKKTLGFNTSENEEKVLEFTF